MDFLLVPVGSAGDVHPYVAIGAALRARGHDVTIMTNPHFERLIRRLGVTGREQGRAVYFNTC